MPLVRSGLEPRDSASGGSSAERQGGRVEHVLALQRRVGNRATLRLLSRRAITAGSAAAVRLTLGSDVDPLLAAVAWELTRDGPLDGAGIAKLRGAALRSGDTIDDNERMLIAALIDTDGAHKLHAEHPHGVVPGDTIELRVASITRANRERVRDFGRTTPTRVRLHEGKDDAGWEASLAQAIVQDAGAFAGAARDALAIADAAGVLHQDLYTAMHNAASDSTEGDRAFAAAVYAIARQEHMAVAADLLAGRVKVDEVPPTYLPNKDVQGMYQPEASSGGRKGDTLYLRADTKFLSLEWQATIVHELTHAELDASTAIPEKSPTDPSADRAKLVDDERAAYDAEARFLLKSIGARSGAARDRAIAEVARYLPPTTLLCMVGAATEVLGQDEAVADLRAIYDEMRWSGQPETRRTLERSDFEDFMSRLLGDSEDRRYAASRELDRRIAISLTGVDPVTGKVVAKDAPYFDFHSAPDEGLRGESVLDPGSPAGN